MLYQPHEVAAIIATKAVLIAVQGLGHDPLRAAGAILLELPGLEQRLLVGEASVFLLRYQRRPATTAWQFPTDAASRRDEQVDVLWRQHRPSGKELNSPVL